MNHAIFQIYKQNRNNILINKYNKTDTDYSITIPKLISGYYYIKQKIFLKTLSYNITFSKELN